MQNERSNWLNIPLAVVVIAIAESLLCYMAHVTEGDDHYRGECCI